MNEELRALTDTVDELYQRYDELDTAQLEAWRSWQAAEDKVAEWINNNPEKVYEQE